jgi:murein DD-endopeptidase MepM/ murein hydrolase activator NlpD
MILRKPDGILTQPFAVNYNSSYAQDGLRGHTGEDYVIGYDKVIVAAITAPVYSILNQDNPDFQKYRAVFQIYDDGDFSYEISYGHLKNITVKEGEIVTAGSPVGTEGNYGTCFYGGKLVTNEEKARGTGAGSHLHFQVRKCIRVAKRASGKMYLRNSEGYLKRNGMYYEIVAYDNGYNGCVEPSLFYKKSDRVFYKETSQSVRQLQEKLIKMGYLDKSLNTSYFGDKTLAAYIEYIKGKGVSLPDFLQG